MTTLGSPPGISPLHRVGKYGGAKNAGAIGVIFPAEEPGQLVPTGTVAAAYREVGALPAIGISHETWKYLMGALMLKCMYPNVDTAVATSRRFVVDGI